jgi:catechol 2,3-dioxygenase-like lactoylglutathione lyase family enzyme
VIALHHVQVACPPGGEDAARRFYADGLGLTEVEKPAELHGRGGAWFRAYDGHGAVVAELHVAVEEPFAPARKAHPAFVVDYRRFHLRDPHGNRVEVLQPRDN